MPIFKSQAPPKKEVLKTIGFILIFTCIISFIIILIRQELGVKHIDILSNEIPILFFITMLGLAFIYPELLQDKSKSLSTMRIVVFMMINVICMLMLKVGWHVGNFEDMGINGYWVTIIGFVFGGKVAQTYYENKFGMPDSAFTPVSGQNKTLLTGDPANADLAKRAVEQNKEQLKADFPNISSISDTVDNVNGINTHVVAIYLKDDKAANIPSELKVTLDDNSEKTVPTEIIKNVGTPRIQQLQDQQVTAANTQERGSVCCLITTINNSGYKGVVTSGHVYSNGNSTSIDGAITTGSQPVSLDGQVAGQWDYQLINSEQDIAIVKLNDNYQHDSAISFSDYYTVGDADVKTRNVILVSHESKERAGFILDYNFVKDIPYDDNVWVTMDNIILVGSTNDRNSSQTVSQGGDSGGCVYTLDGGAKKLIGLILGGDDKFTFVLPVKDTLTTWNFKPL